MARPNRQNSQFIAIPQHGASSCPGISNWLPPSFLFLSSSIFYFSFLFSILFFLVDFFPGGCALSFLLFFPFSPHFFLFFFFFLFSCYFFHFFLCFLLHFYFLFPFQFSSFCLWLLFLIFSFSLEDVVIPGNFLWGKFAIFLFKKPQATWSRYFLQNFPKNLPHFQGFFY